MSILESRDRDELSRLPLLDAMLSALLVMISAWLPRSDSLFHKLAEG